MQRAWRSLPWTGLPSPTPYLLRAARAVCWKGSNRWVCWLGRPPRAVTPPPPKRCHQSGGHAGSGTVSPPPPHSAGPLSTVLQGKPLAPEAPQSSPCTVTELGEHRGRCSPT